MKYVLYMILLIGCATASEAMDNINTAHNMTQAFVDGLQVFCQQEKKDREARGEDVKNLVAYCESSWELFKAHKRISDPLLEE